MNLFGALQEKKTLLVDDDELIRESISMVFATKGCFIKTAETAEQGLKVLEEQKFDIIISDLRLPGIDGLRFLRFAMMIQPEPVKFLITAYKDDHVLSEALRIGVNEFIEKPFKLDSFIELLTVTMEKQAQQ